MVINLLPTGHKEQFREAFIDEIMNASREPSESHHELHMYDYYIKVEKKYITDKSSTDTNWEHGVIEYELGYTGIKDVQAIKGRFVGAMLVFAASPEAMISDKFNHIYMRFINNILTQAEAREYYDELDY